MAAVKQTDFSILPLWITLSFLSTIIFGTIYVTVHQNYRQTANDPQTQLVEDTIQQLEAGKKVTWTEMLDVSKTQSPFVIIYDENGSPVVGNAEIDGKPPVPPKGVFDYTKDRGIDKITWQPKDDVRLATIIEHYNGGFVLAARSLRDIEKREQILTLEVGAAWIASIFGSFLLLLVIKITKN